MSDIHAAARDGSGWAALSDEALPAVSSSTQIFANADAGTRIVRLTVRGGVLSVTFDASAATATNGHDFDPGTYDIAMSAVRAKAVRAIQASGTVTGHITYLGKA